MKPTLPNKSDLLSHKTAETLRVSEPARDPETLRLVGSVIFGVPAQQLSAQFFPSVTHRMWLLLWETARSRMG